MTIIMGTDITTTWLAITSIIAATAATGMKAIAITTMGAIMTAVMRDRGIGIEQCR